MDIKLWYSKTTRQWRWTFVHPVSGSHESGQQWDLHDAMNDIANTVEHVVQKHEYEGEYEGQE